MRSYSDCGQGRQADQVGTETGSTDEVFEWQGSLAGLGTPGGAGSAASPGVSPGGEAAAAGQLSATELYSKYVEMHERYRSERLKNRQQEIVMEELCSEVEKRAALVKEQQVWGGGKGG